jgi:hypothetical protein
MSKDFDQILDECIDRINSGQSLEECLELYPEFAQELEPLLRAADELRSQSYFMPSQTAKVRGRQRFSQAIAQLEQKRQQSRAPLVLRLFRQRRVWAPVAATIALALIGYGLWTVLSPTPTPMAYAGTLEVRVTDAPTYDVSAISVTVGDIEVHKTEDGRWLSVIKEDRSFDLLKLREVEEVLGSKEVDTGRYTQIRMDVKNVTVTIGGKSQSAVLPSGKLKLLGSFEVEKDKTTVLTLDFDADKCLESGKGKVIFKPVVNLKVARNVKIFGFPSPIQRALGDGEGSEFVRPIPGLAPTTFRGSSEFEAVEAVVKWVAENYLYEEDTGEVWTPSDEMYTRLKGDCEDWAVLLASLLRFHTQGGIPAERVWVAINAVASPGRGVVAGHAWVGYKPQKGGMVHIEPGSTILYHQAPKGMLNFNDSWVEGGGCYIKAHGYS